MLGDFWLDNRGVVVSSVVVIVVVDVVTGVFVVRGASCVLDIAP